MSTNIYNFGHHLFHKERIGMKLLLLDNKSFVYIFVEKVFWDTLFNVS